MKNLIVRTIDSMTFVYKKKLTFLFLLLMNIKADKIYSFAAIVGSDNN